MSMRVSAKVASKTYESWNKTYLPHMTSPFFHVAAPGARTLLASATNQCHNPPVKATSYCQSDEA
jgi:hypothetical protein